MKDRNRFGKKGSVSIVVVLTVFLIFVASSLSIYYFLSNDSLEASNIADSNLNRVYFQEQAIEFYFMNFGREVLDELDSEGLEFSEELFKERFIEKSNDYWNIALELEFPKEEKLRLFKILSQVRQGMEDSEVSLEQDRIFVKANFRANEENSRIQIDYQFSRNYIFDRNI